MMIAWAILVCSAWPPPAGPGAASAAPIASRWASPSVGVPASHSNLPTSCPHDWVVPEDEEDDGTDGLRANADAPPPPPRHRATKPVPPSVRFIPLTRSPLLRC